MKSTIGIILVLFGLFIGCISNKNKSREQFAIAKEYFGKKDYTNALKEADNALILDGTNYDAVILKAKIKSKTGFFICSSPQASLVLSQIKKVLPFHGKTFSV